MFSVRNVPVVIEPGVGALEAEFFIKDDAHGHRTFPLQLQRLELDENVVAKLPFIPATQFPHAFSLVGDVDKSAVIVVYDFLGRIACVYTRGDDKSAWDRCDVADEHAGKTVTQFSVRFNFSSVKERTTFLELVDKMVKDAKKDLPPSQHNVMRALKLLGRSRVPPVVMPVAVAKAALTPVRL
ncbi:hypothetical protein EBZ39_04300 [bacterium]|nr:hypothetical protein [bacterium]